MFRLIALRAAVNIRVRISGSSLRCISVIISILNALTSRWIASVAFDTKRDLAVSKQGRHVSLRDPSFLRSK